MTVVCGEHFKEQEISVYRISNIYYCLPAVDDKVQLEILNVSYLAKYIARTCRVSLEDSN